MTLEERRLRARRRALRAARVVTIAAALAGGAGCTASHGAPEISADASPREDGGTDTLVRRDATPDAPLDAVADAPPDAVADAAPDAACPEPQFEDCCEPMPRHCCEEEVIGFWDEASNCCVTCVVGPLVPPSMTV